MRTCFLLYQFNTGTAKHLLLLALARRTPSTSAVRIRTLYGVNVACLRLNPYHDFPTSRWSTGVNHVRDTGEARLAGRLRFEPNPD